VIWVFFIVVAVLVIGGFAALLLGRIGYDPMAEPTSTQADPVLPDRIGSDEISAIRFDTALRGYRMDQVDAVLERLQARIAELEASGGTSR
jgi:DivIVA domain-containing protein